MGRSEAALKKDFSDWCQFRDIQPLYMPRSISKGFPDRYIQLPSGGGTFYVEFKGSSIYYGLDAMQKWWQKKLLDSSPHRYIVVDDEESLAKAKQMCLDLIKIGPNVIEYEAILLRNVDKIL